MDVYEVKFDSDDYHEILAMRDRLLRRPLGLTWSQMDLEGESEQFHFGLYDQSGTPIACVVINPLDDKTAKLRQMCVEEAHRAIGAGRQLIQSVEEILREKGIRKIKMDARKAAVGFYLKLGYQTEGDEFTQVTIPHFRMTKTLGSD
ncbi:MAG: GNAT family N-acetyltransferase [bacterium]|nr:GNAT family N-acetyltransferase [bacterium]